VIFKPLNVVAVKTASGLNLYKIGLGVCFNAQAQQVATNRRCSVLIQKSLALS